MSVTVELPAAYRRHAQGQGSVALPAGGRLQDVLAQLCGTFAGLKTQLLAADGRIYGSVAVFVNGVDARRLRGMDTDVRAGDVLTLVPAISGG
jgi:molybdopterin synthase sulfur carrier subunit